MAVEGSEWIHKRTEAVLANLMEVFETSEALLPKPNYFDYVCSMICVSLLEKVLE